MYRLVHACRIDGKHEKEVLTSLVFVILLTGMIGYAKAVTETFTVPPHPPVVRTVLLNEGDKVSGSINVTGGSGNDINFYITDPNENTIRRFDRATQTSFSFTASITGTYTLHFDNSFSILSSKSVTLGYTISESIFGLAPELFYLLVAIIAIVIVATIVAFALKRGKPTTQP